VLTVNGRLLPIHFVNFFGLHLHNTMRITLHGSQELARFCRHSPRPVLEVAPLPFQALGIPRGVMTSGARIFGSQSPRDAKDGIDKPSHLGRRASFDEKTRLKRQPFA
jgi:hypothetical protein